MKAALILLLQMLEIEYIVLDRKLLTPPLTNGWDTRFRIEKVIAKVAALNCS